MELFPEGAPRKLGCRAVETRLARYVQSPLGGDRLDALTPSHDLERVQRDLDRVAEMSDALEFDDPVPLSPMIDVRETVRQAGPEDAFVGPDALVEVRRVLTTVRRLHDYFEKRSGNYPRLSAVTGRIEPLESLEEEIERVIDPDQSRVRDDASDTLRSIRSRIRQKKDDLRRALDDELADARSRGYAAEDRPTIRNGRMVIPVRVEAKRKVEGFVHDTSSTGQTVYIEPATCLDLNNEVRELEVQEKQEVERILREVTGRIRRHADAVRTNLDALGRIDLIQAKARMAADMEAVAPEVTADGELHLREAVNPVLQLRLEQDDQDQEEAVHEVEEVVPLDIELGDEFDTLVVTGPNAGGKTVSMKTVGLLVWMVSCGLPIPVDEDRTRVSLFERLYVDIGDEQSIEKDLSTFSSHLANLRYMVERADERSLILIDEAGTGTDPSEGGALAQSILEHLTGLGAKTIATTHHGTLKLYAHEADRVENASLEFDQESLRPTYRFQTGVPGSSYAFEVAGRLGLPEPLLNRARELVGEEKTSLESLITTLEARTQQLETELEEAREEARQAKHARREYEDRLEKLEREQEEIRAEALEEAERMVQEANARIERTIREIKEAQAEQEATKEARSQLESFREQVSEMKADAEEKADAAREESGEPETPEGVEAEPGPLREGDRVVLDDGTNEAEVMEIEGDEVVLTMGGMRIRADRDRLTRVGGPREQQVSVSKHSGSGGGDSRGSELPSLRASKRLDVRGYHVQEALSEVDRFIDESMAADLEEVEILHGKGTGALRGAIQDMLSSDGRIDHFEEAEYYEGGAGVTVVHL